MDGSTEGGDKRPTSAEAARALAQIESTQAQVEREAARFRPDRPVVLAATALLTVLVYAKKDVSRPEVRVAGGVLYWLAVLGYGSWFGYAIRVSASDPDDALAWARMRERWQAEYARFLERKQSGEPSEPGTFTMEERVRKRYAALGEALAVGCAVTAAERAVVACLRHSSLRYPNVVAGFVLATTRTAISGLQLPQRFLEEGKRR